MAISCGSPSPVKFQVDGRAHFGHPPPRGGARVDKLVALSPDRGHLPPSHMLENMHIGEGCGGSEPSRQQAAPCGPAIPCHGWNGGAFPQPRGAVQPRCPSQHSGSPAVGSHGSPHLGQASHPSSPQVCTRGQQGNPHSCRHPGAPQAFNIGCVEHSVSKSGSAANLESKHIESEIESSAVEVDRLAEEVKELRQELRREEAETLSCVREYEDQIKSLERDNTRMQAQLQTKRSREGRQQSDVEMLRKDMCEKTNAIEKLMNELHQQQQQAISKAKNLANAMLSVCALSPDDGRGANQNSGFVQGGADGLRSTSRAGSWGSGESNGEPSAGSRRRKDPSPAPPNESSIRPSAANPKDSQQDGWFKSVKANLEEFGDVEVFIDNTCPPECGCCLEAMNTPYCVKPRKCSHVFHIECLLQSWSEGVCPVCGTSFAPDPG